MLKATDKVIHLIYEPVIYDVSALNLTLLPPGLEQRINSGDGITRICQADSPTHPDGNVSTFWQLYKGAALLPSETFETVEVSDNFLAGCLL